MKEEPDKIELDKTISYHNKENQILGCKHYKRGCKIRAMCCGRLFVCRFCHNEEMSNHQIDRYATQEMMCMHCCTLQSISQKCSNEMCKKEIARYYCPICKFHDDDPSKSIYHCHQCGLCRVGKGLGIDFFHCQKCNMCLAIGTKDSHKCIENNMKSDCPICHNDLFTSTISSYPLKCGHAMHSTCYSEYSRRNFTCPLCFKSIHDMSLAWKEFDELVEQQPMPQEFKDAKCFVLCSDCEKKSETTFHFVGIKCSQCGSYNTKIISTSGFPERVISTPLNLPEQTVQLEEETLEEKESEEE